MIIENQVEFIKSDLMKGSDDQKQLKEKRKREKDADESMEESDFEMLEKKLTPLERERLLIKQ